MNFEDIFIIKSFDITSTVVHQSSTSRDLKTIGRNLGGHRFDARMRLEVKPEMAKAAFGFICNLQRNNQFFDYSDHLLGGGTDRTVNGARSAGDSQIALTSVAGVSVYDFVRFASHSKLYQIIDIAGNTLTLNTPLQGSVAGSTTASMANPSLRLELPPELKQDATLASRLRRELSSINLRFWERV